MVIVSIDLVSIVIMIFVILIFVALKRIESKGLKSRTTEGYYYNPHRICLQYGEDYPSYWADQYGKYGDRWPYKKKIDEYNEQPTKCGGCWATPSPTSMFKEE